MNDFNKNLLSNQKSSELVRLEKMQRDIEANIINIDSISEDDFIKISELYDKQLKEINNQIKSNEEHIEKCKIEILKMKK